ncbi:MAG: hypothetical protein MHM6MM_001729 [Cercozoa sp. M6MM]
MALVVVCCCLVDGILNRLRGLFDTGFVQGVGNAVGRALSAEASPLRVRPVKTPSQLLARLRRSMMRVSDARAASGATDRALRRLLAQVSAVSPQDTSLATDAKSVDVLDVSAARRLATIGDDPIFHNKWAKERGELVQWHLDNAAANRATEEAKARRELMARQVRQFTQLVAETALRKGPHMVNVWHARVHFMAWLERQPEELCVANMPEEQRHTFFNHRDLLFSAVAAQLDEALSQCDTGDDVQHVADKMRREGAALGHTGQRVEEARAALNAAFDKLGTAASQKDADLQSQAVDEVLASAMALSVRESADPLHYDLPLHEERIRAREDWLMFLHSEEQHKEGALLSERDLERLLRDEPAQLDMLQRELGTVTESLRKLGEAANDNRAFVLNGQEVLSADEVARVLRHLRGVARRALGLPRDIDGTQRRLLEEQMCISLLDESDKRALRSGKLRTKQAMQRIKYADLPTPDSFTLALKWLVDAPIDHLVLADPAGEGMRFRQAAAAVLSDALETFDVVPSESDEPVLEEASAPQLEEVRTQLSHMLLSNAAAHGVTTTETQRRTLLELEHAVRQLPASQLPLLSRMLAEELEDSATARRHFASLRVESDPVEVDEDSNQQAQLPRASIDSVSIPPYADVPPVDIEAEHAKAPDQFVVTEQALRDFQGQQPDDGLHNKPAAPHQRIAPRTGPVLNSRHQSLNLDPETSDEFVASELGNGRYLGDSAVVEQATYRLLIESGCHWASPRHSWNPQMVEYLLGQRGDYLVFDLTRTVAALRRTIRFLQDVTSNGGTIMFVGTSDQSARSVRYVSRTIDAPFVADRWTPGMFTNWAGYKEALEHRQKTAEAPTEAEVNFSRLETAPDVIVVADRHGKMSLLREAASAHIPVVSLVDAHDDLRAITYAIPCNTASPQSVYTVLDLLARGIAEAKTHGDKINATYKLPVDNEVVELMGDDADRQRAKKATGASETPFDPVYESKEPETFEESQDAVATRAMKEYLRNRASMPKSLGAEHTVDKHSGAIIGERFERNLVVKPAVKAAHDLAQQVHEAFAPSEARQQLHEHLQTVMSSSDAAAVASALVQHFCTTADARVLDASEGSIDHGDGVLYTESGMEPGSPEALAARSEAARQQRMSSEEPQTTGTASPTNACDLASLSTLTLGGMLPVMTRRPKSTAQAARLAAAAASEVDAKLGRSDGVVLESFGMDHHGAVRRVAYDERFSPLERAWRRAVLAAADRALPSGFHDALLKASPQHGDRLLHLLSEYGADVRTRSADLPTTQSVDEMYISHVCGCVSMWVCGCVGV